MCFFYETAATEINRYRHTLSLHAPLPIAHRLVERVLERGRAAGHRHHARDEQQHPVDVDLLALDVGGAHVDHALQPQARGSEEHTSELQSLMRISYDVFCMKKKKKIDGSCLIDKHRLEK